MPTPAQFAGGHPARRVFQAIRIAVNDEIASLERALPEAWRLIRPGGRIAAISFQSLEDRIVKRFLVDRARGCICPPESPICTCGREPEAELLTRRPVSPTPEEVAAQPACPLGQAPRRAEASRGGADHRRPDGAEVRALSAADAPTAAAQRSPPGRAREDARPPARLRPRAPGRAPRAATAPSIPRRRPPTAPPLLAAPRPIAVGPRAGCATPGWSTASCAGRAWIGLLCVLLIGLVGLNVSLLKLNAAAGRNAEWAKKLRVENADLQARVSQARSGQRIQDAARQMGFVMPAAGERPLPDRRSRAGRRARGQARDKFTPMCRHSDIVSAGRRLRAARAAPWPRATAPAGGTTPTTTAATGDHGRDRRPRHRGDRHDRSDRRHRRTPSLAAAQHRSDRPLSGARATGRIAPARLVERRIGLLFACFLALLALATLRELYLIAFKGSALRSLAATQQVEKVDADRQARHDHRPPRHRAGRLRGCLHDLREPVPDQGPGRRGAEARADPGRHARRPRRQARRSQEGLRVLARKVSPHMGARIQRLTSRASA